MKMINVYDNFLSPEDHVKVNEYVKSSPYYYGILDPGYDIPTGVSHKLDLDHNITVVLDSLLRNHYELPQLSTIYTNLFRPNEASHFHTDCKLENTYTGLYYANTEEWNYDEGGETQFLINDEIYGILPKPNRMILFDSRLLHKATPFRDRHRWTIALKYG